MKEIIRSVHMFVICFLAISGASSALGSEQIHRQHDIHEHGGGELNLAMESNEIQIELRMPAMNIVGFEHQPNNQEQKDAIQKALKILNDANQLFALAPDARCLVKKSKAITTAIEEDHNEGENEEEIHDEEETHSEFHGSYLFSCESPKELTTLQVKLFDLFKNIEELDVQIVKQGEQTSQELTAKASRIMLHKKKCTLSLGSWCLF